MPFLWFNTGLRWFVNTGSGSDARFSSPAPAVYPRTTTYAARLHALLDYSSGPQPTVLAFPGPGVALLAFPLRLLYRNIRGSARAYAVDSGGTAAQPTTLRIPAF